MSLTAGQSLSHYEILGPLGTGGMGEVWSARDTRLDRRVAIKVLPDELAGDDERLQRFQREAKSLAALNHSNVAQIFGIDEVGDTCFIAMELVPGEDLVERLKRGALPLEEAVNIGRQIAEGLEAAHDAGVVHRDLKPANIRVTPEGAAKVLDFGLAKPSGSHTSDPKSESSLVTGEGNVLGTPTYMSPEQARGKPSDRRTDVWAFGCVLYECIVGQRAFGGATVPDVLAGVLEREPDWSALPASTPPALRRLMKRCLIKDPRSRLQHVGEARIVLEDPDALAGDAETSRNPAVTRAVPVLGAALLGIVAYWFGTRGTMTNGPTRTARLTIAIPADQQLSGLNAVAPPFAIALDGTAVAYVARKSDEPPALHLRALSAFESIELPGTDGAEAPFFSPDGLWVGFFRDRSLYKVPVRGGSPIEICSVALFDRPSATWGRDDTIVFTAGVNVVGRLQRVPAAGGVPMAMTLPDRSNRESWHGLPEFLPGEDRLLFTVATPSGLRAALLDTDLGTWRVVEGTGEAAGARFLPGADGRGSLIFAQAGRLMAADFDPYRGELAGIPTVVQETISSSALGPGHWDVSNEGTLVFVPGDVVETALVRVDRSGEVTWRAPELGGYQHPRISPDGNRLLYDAQGSTGRDLWMYDLNREMTTRLTFVRTNMDPVWTPDGTALVFSSFVESVRTLHILEMDRVGAEPRRLLEGEHDQVGGAWAPSGELLFTVLDPETGGDIWILSGLEAPEAKPLLAGPNREGWATLSPDGRFMAYVSDESGRSEVYACSYPELSGKRPVSRSGGEEPLWSRDGKEIFYRQGDSYFTVPVEVDGDGIGTGEPVRLFGGRYDQSPSGHQHYDVSSDGRHFALVELLQDHSPSQLRVVLNWHPGEGDALPTSD